MSDESDAKEEGKEKGKEEGKEKEKEEGKSFWATLPGILAQIAAVIVAITGLVVALREVVPPRPPATPVPATLTPSPTPPTPMTLAPSPAPSTPVTLTPLPTLTFTPEPSAIPTCDPPVDRQFVALWDRDRLGCSIEPAESIYLAQEPFERGYMLWRGDLRYIYVLYDDGTWQRFRDTWEEGQLEYTCPELASSKTPPTPCRGFGKVWCQESEVRDKIGPAEDKERGYTGVIQAFQRGLMVTSDGSGIYILYDDGTWEGF